MHADLIAAMKAGWPIVHLVTVTLPGHTIRWTDGGFVKWGANTYRVRDATYGVLDSISDITDGIDDDAAPVQIVITPPDLTSLATLASSDAQGGWVTIHVAAKNPTTGLLVDEPYQIHLGELDQPRIRPGKTRALAYDIITGEARGLQPNEEQRQTDAFHQYIWPGELGDEYATDGTKLSRWRSDDPRNAIGVLTGRGAATDNKAIEFTYEPNAPLVFPFGVFGIAGEVRKQVGYSRYNAWWSVFATFGASGPIKSALSVNIDDEERLLDGSAFDAYDRALSGSHAGVMWFKWLPGDQPSPALTSPTGPNAASIQATGWTSAHKFSGRPAFCWTGKENSKESEYRGGPPKIVITGEGLFGHDPRAPGSDLADPTTWPWIDEGCIAALNWTYGRWEGSNGGSPAAYGVPYASVAVGGIAAPLSTIDVSAFTAAASIADTNGWKMGGVADSEEDKIDVLEDMLRASGAVRSRRCGMISCVSFGAIATTVLTATAADTISAPEISLGPSILDRKNTGIARFLSRYHQWEMTPVSAVSDSAWVTEDGGRQTAGYDYKFSPTATQGAQLVYLEMAHAREKISADVTFKPWMLQLEPGDAFEWDEPEFLLTGTKVRVRKRTWSPASCTVKIGFRQETDAKYAAAMAQTGVAPPSTAPGAPVDRTPDPPDILDWDVQPKPVQVSGVQLPGLLVTGAVADDTASTVQIEVGPTNTGPWEQVYFGPASAKSVSVDGLVSGDDYYVAITNLSPELTPSLPLVKGPYTAPDLVSSTFVDAGALAVLDQADTPEIAANAVTNYIGTYTGAALTLGGTTPTTIQTVTFTTTGSPLEIRANFFLNIYHPAGGGVDARIQIVQASPFGGNLFDETFPAVGDDYLQGWQTPTVTITRAAGTYTFTVIVTLSNNTSATQTVQSRLLSVQEFKR
ncbi:MAG: hypothetical protein ACOH2M_24275 [Cypionkella sp.]